MKKTAYLLIFCLIAFFFQVGAVAAKKPAKVLVFSKTLAFRHKSIKDGIAAIHKLGKENNFLVDTTESTSLFTDEVLKNYRAIIFLSPTGEFFNEAEKNAFQNYLRNGGGFVGIHAATDCLFEWDWYGKMVGAYFVDHPKVQPAQIIVHNQKHQSTKHLPKIWKHTDEWYNLRNINPAIKQLLRVDEKTYTGGKNGEIHPVAWYHKFEGARVFTTVLGHTPESYSNDAFLKHLLGGIKYAAKLK